MRINDKKPVAMTIKSFKFRSSLFKGLWGQGVKPLVGF